MDNNKDRLLDVEEVAAYLGYSVGTVYNKASSGEIPYTKLPSGALRFRLSAIDAWVDSHSHTPQPKPAPAAEVA